MREYYVFFMFGFNLLAAFNHPCKTREEKNRVFFFREAVTFLFLFAQPCARRKRTPSLRRVCVASPQHTHTRRTPPHPNTMAAAGGGHDPVTPPLSPALASIASLVDITDLLAP